MHRSMWLVRRFDERRLQRRGDIGPFAPVNGQEAVHVGPMECLTADDWEAAILGVDAMREAPVLERDHAGATHLIGRLELPLIVAFDHRLNDGMDAARFANAISEALSDPRQMLLAA